MKIYREYPFQVKKEKRAVALGFFDGVHLGHQKLLNELLAISKKRNLLATVFTFDSHPKNTINKSFTFPGLITQLKTRLNKLEEHGVEECIVAPMISAISNIPAETFYFKYLIEQFGTKTLIVGGDAHFGYKGAGNVEHLKKWTQASGIELIVVADLLKNEEKVSSTYIRQLLEAGEIETANQLLGYAYQIQGEVVHGKKLGRTLGFPTINVTHDDHLVKPRSGVYGSRVLFKNQVFPSITSIGVNPTVETDSKIKIETYIYDKNIDLYEEKVIIELLGFIRNEIHFSSIHAMKDRIHSDLENVEQMHRQGDFLTSFK